MAQSPELTVRQEFTSPEEELAYLRAQIAEKEQLLAERGHVVETAQVVHETVAAYQETPPQEVLSPDYQMSEADAHEVSLDLPADDDDQLMAEMLQLSQEKGIKNAMTVVAQMNNPHLLDDFHRILVQYVQAGYPAPGLKEGDPLWDVLHMTLFEVTLPQFEKEDGARGGIKELISGMEQFYAGMLSIADEKTLGKRHFTFEIAVSEAREDIIFYIAVPTDKKILFQKHLASLFPDAHVVEQKSDYNIFPHQGATEVAVATLKEEAILPIKSYDLFDHDPLNVIINVFSKLAHRGEGASIQFVVRPVGDRYLKRYREVLRKVEKGEKLKDALKDTPENISGEIFKLGRELYEGFKTQKSKETEEPKITDQTVVEQIREKMNTPVVATNMRVVVSALNEGRARAVLSDITSSFNQFENTSGNRLQFTAVKKGNVQEALQAYSYRKYRTAETMPLSLHELTTLAHLPEPSIVHSSPEFKQMKSASVAAPLGLPTEGTYLGMNNYRGKETKAFATEKDRVRHMYVIGQTGTGKSVYLQNMAVQDIQQGHGVCFIDPHGSDVQDILAAVPEHRYEDVIYFDPGHAADVMALNMLEYDEAKPEQKTFVINELFGIFRKLYAHSPESMGPAFEQYFRNATALVIEDPKSGNTLLDVSRVMTDEAYRNFKIARSKNPVVNQFWTEVATKAGGEASLANIVPYITNKFDVFTANDIMRPIIAQPKSTFNFRELMDNRKILLVNLSKGKLGDINANLIGLIIVGKILMAALSRVDMTGEKPPFYLYIDEFQNITTDSISAILSEARKYALGLTVAHQFVAQLEQGIRDAVFGNVGSMSVFRVGAEDAEFLESQFHPVFKSSDIMNIPNYNCYLRLLANGIPQTPFNIATAPPPEGRADVAEYLRKLSLQKYATPRDEVNEMINRRYG